LEDPRVVWERAREYSRKALELEPDNGEARMIQAYVAAYADQDEARAEKLAREVLATDPGSINLQIFAGQLLGRVGRFTEAETLLRQAVQGDPTLLLARQVLAHHYYLSRQFDLAKREAWRVIRMTPRNPTGYGLLVLPAWATGEWRLASIIAGRAKQAGLNQPAVAMGLAYTFGRTGRTDEARAIVNRMDEMARMGHVSSLQRAVAHLGLGEEDEAVRLMGDCLRAGCVNPSLFRLDPVFDPLRTHPGYAALTR
jgi:Flp pilus assembly protein TadD